jgi:putative salt-induced outer membrane protein
MENMRKRVPLLFMAMVLLCPNLFADQVSLKNGDRLTGTILKSDAKTLVLKTESAGEVTIQWAAIDSLTSTQPLHVGLTGGQMIVGPVATNDGKIQIATQTSGLVTISKDSIQVIRSNSEQVAYDAEIERLRHPHLLDFWSGVVDTGLSLTRGNSDTLTYSLAGKAVRTTSRDKITVYSNAIYAKSGTPSLTTAHAIRGGIRGDFDLNAKFFAFGFTDFEYDAFQHLDLRNVIGGGLGYHMYKTEKTSFDVFGGASYNQEYYSNVPLVNPTPPPPTILGSLHRKSAELVVGEELNTKLSSRTTLFERFALYPNLSGGGNYRSQFDLTATTKLKNWLGWQVTYSDRYITNPPIGLKGNDQLLSTGLRLSFGKQ